MKILMINIVCGIRSTGRICTDLARALESLGHEVKIAYGRENVPEQFQKYAIRIGSNIDVKVHGIKARLFDGCGFGSKKATEKFVEWIKEFNPDVIHLHNIHGYYINIEILFNYLRTCGKKIVWTLHDCWAFTGHSAYCDSINCERWIKGCHDCPIKKEYPKSLLDFSKHNWVKKKQIMKDIPDMTIVTPSMWLSELVKKSFLAQYPVVIINNGIDISKFQRTKGYFRTKYGLENKTIIIGVSTAWDEMKGLSDYIELSGVLDANYKVILVGLTKKQIQMLPSNMLGIEKTNSIEELVDVYSSSDFLVNMSKCENYPTVNLEAFACGVPVISYDVGGSQECVFEGIVVKDNSVNTVAEVIKNYTKYENINCVRKNMEIDVYDISNDKTIKEYLKQMVSEI